MEQQVFNGSINCSCGFNIFTKKERTANFDNKTVTIVNAKCIQCKREIFHSKTVVTLLILTPEEINTHENLKEST